MDRTPRRVLSRLFSRPSDGNDRIRRARVTLGVTPLEDRTVPTLFTVTSAAGDMLTPDGLWQTILNANIDETATPNAPHRIQFNLGNGVQVINLQAMLPTIKRPTIIDGVFRPADKPNQRIVLDGAGMGFAGPLPGLWFSWVAAKNENGETTGTKYAADKSAVLGLTLRGFRGSGIRLEGVSDVQIGGPNANEGNAIYQCDGNGITIEGTDRPNNAGGQRNKIIGNLIGTDGTAPDPVTSPTLGNGLRGIYVGPLTNQTQIGGASGGYGNTIVNNQGDGVYVWGQGTTILGNKVGTVNDDNLSGNKGWGIAVGPYAANTTIGGQAAATGDVIDAPSNVISGNKLGGIYFIPPILPDSIGNVGFCNVQGNFIGVKSDGFSPLPNTGPGIKVERCAGIVIGGPGVGRYNVISGNTGDGVQVVQATQLEISYNDIGTAKDSSEQPGLKNGGNGISVDAKSDKSTIKIKKNQGVSNTLSGIRVEFDDTTPAGILIEENDLFHNGLHGLALVALTALVAPNPAGGALVQNNTIRENDQDGILASGGGSHQLLGNTITGNEADGVRIADRAGFNLIKDNQIAGNQGSGVWMERGCLGNTVGEMGDGNTITDNQGDGVHAEIGDLGGNALGLGVTDNTITGNHGTGLALVSYETLTAADPNYGATVTFNDVLSNYAYGVLVHSGGSHTIANNDVSSNQSDGIHLDTFAAFTTVATDTVRWNQGDGVRIEQSGPGNSVVGSAVTGNMHNGVYAEAGALAGVPLGMSISNSTIEYNGWDGIAVYGSGPPLASPDPAYAVSISGDVVSGNSRDGVHVTGGGNTQMGLNWVFYNSGHGVMWDGGSRYNQISGGSIYQNGGAGLAYLDPVGNKSNGTTYDQNGGLGIDYGDDGVTAPLPIIEWAKRDMITHHVIVKGYVSWEPNTTYGVEILGNYSPDPSWHGEGLELVGGATVVTDANGYGGFRVDVGDIPYPYVSATETGQETDMRTSEFSEDVEVVPAPTTISGWVWDDGYANPYENLYVGGNNAQDPDDTGIGGLLVRLYDDQGNLVDETTTSTGIAPGYYSFDVEPGTYRVRFFLPAGDELTHWIFSLKDMAPDDIDSDAYTDAASPDFGYTDFVTLDLGDAADFDAGMFSIHDSLPGGNGP